MIKILIIGLGTIGFRHFQSLCNFETQIEIDCCDLSDKALRKVQDYSNEINNSHKVTILQNLDQIKKNYDFLIHSTSANIRLKTLKMILKKSKIKFAIFEKILVQNLNDLNEIEQLSSSFNKCWVNTPMHEWDLYNKIKKQINISDVKQIEFNFFDGLACNAIHFIDFVSSWKNQLPSKIDNSNLFEWYESKRKGFFDVYGELKIIFPDKTILILRSNPNKSDYHCIIREKNRKWTLIEKEEKFFSSDGYAENGKVEFQSELTKKIIHKIIKKEKCYLPDLQWSVKCHHILIKSLLNYWNSYYKTNDNIIPIT